MKIPKQIKIGHLTYEVGDLVDSNETHQGKSSLRDQWIRISNLSVSEDAKFATFLHEVIHQIFDQNAYDEETKNEKLIDLLCNNLYQVLKENNLLK